jgi:hypothetical protein
MPTFAGKMGFRKVVDCSLRRVRLRDPKRRSQLGEDPLDCLARVRRRGRRQHALAQVRYDLAHRVAHHVAWQERVQRPLEDEEIALNARLLSSDRLNADLILLWSR